MFPTKRIEVTTRSFEAAHGKRPSGRGNWAFCPAQYYNRANYTDFTFWYNGLYSDAKRAAADHFRSFAGVTLLTVCS